MKITVTPNPNHGTLPASDKLGFGTVFTDHMFLMDYAARTARCSCSDPGRTLHA